MAPNSDDFLKRLLATFKVEAGEHVSAVSSNLVALEQSSGEEQVGLIETIFREAHSLKGAARAVNQAEIETICQSLESVFSSLKRKEINLSPALFDLLHRAVDALGKLPLSIEAQTTAPEKAAVAQLAQDLERAAKGTLPLSKGEGLKKTEEESLAVPSPETLPLHTERGLQADTGTRVDRKAGLASAPSRGIIIRKADNETTGCRVAGDQILDRGMGETVDTNPS